MREPISGPKLSALCERLGIGELPDGFDAELGRLGEEDLKGGKRYVLLQFGENILPGIRVG